MRIAFALQAWAASAPGLSTTEQWLDWARAPWLPHGTSAPDLSRFPALMRRRLGSLGRLTVAVADAVMPSGDVSGIPVVWTSRYGDVGRSLELLFEQARQQPLSPTAFSLSVHNAIGAQHSIARQMRANAVCVAGGACSAEAGVLEAVSLLHDGASEVILVCHDAPLPGAYDRFEDGAACEYAWALRLSLQPSADERQIVLEMTQAQEATEPDARTDDAALLPHGLQVLRFLLTGEGRWRVPHARGAWTWSHGHA
ncbi:beta-ketoacyl synthase chain length factor [Imbroritus primus]|uniref:beta-ketoacyl synthase chain length factor n=1 Tax=Imbroritus primus TaxID=3058603 RepID=UPI000569A9D9